MLRYFFVKHSERAILYKEIFLQINTRLKNYLYWFFVKKYHWRSVGIVRLRTRATEFIFFLVSLVMNPYYSCNEQHEGTCKDKKIVKLSLWQSTVQLHAVEL
jgi:hypothetical protein